LDALKEAVEYQEVEWMAEIRVNCYRTRGRNIRLSNDRCIASRADTEFCHGYVFTTRPVQLGERVVIQILATEPMYVGALAFGLTSCDPAMIQGADLPDDSDLLLDRPEYWVVSKDVASCPQRGDELSFCITHTGLCLSKCTSIGQTLWSHDWHPASHSGGSAL
jgi:protein neuralized